MRGTTDWPREGGDELSRLAFAAGRRAVWIAALAPLVAAIAVALDRLLERRFAGVIAAEETLLVVFLAAWCGMGGALCAILLDKTAGKERRGTRIAAVVYAVGLWIPSSVAAIMLSLTAAELVDRFWAG